jgi:DNA-binding NarL/FixJ family response regulator
MDGPLGHPPSPALGDDELVVLRLMAEGQTVETVARRLEVSERTVRRRVRSACSSAGVDTTVEAIVWAVRHRLI